MQIIICGAGQVGTSIARQLANEGNDVTVIDHSPEKIQKISETLDVRAFVGFASHPPILEAAGAPNADMIIAVTVSDEINMVACQVAHSLFNIPVKIARIRHNNYLLPIWKDLYRHDHLPIDVIISPEQEVAEAVIHRLHVPGALDTIPFVNGKIKAIALRCTKTFPALQTPVDNLQTVLKDMNAVILGIHRNEEFLIPQPKLHIEEDDEIYFICDSNYVEEVMAFFGHEEREARRIVIIGSGNIGLYLAEHIEEESPDVRLKMIEIDKRQAEFAAEQLSTTTVINGNALSHDILEEANISATDTVIAVTNDDEVNILSSLLSKKLGCRTAVTLINNSGSYSSLVSSLGIDIDVNPRETTVSSILQYIRRGRILHVHSVCEGNAEIIEAEAVESSTIVGKTIDNLDLPFGVFIGCILREEEVIIPNQSTVIQANDRIIIISQSHLVSKVEKIFSVKFEFF